MLISTKGRYALRVMVDLAQQNTQMYTPLKDIAKRQEISEKYLESIIVMLSKAGYVEGVRGKGGGYRLTKDPSGYTAKEIVEITNGSLAPVACLKEDAEPCNREEKCVMLPMYKSLYSNITEFLGNITIKDIVEGNADVDEIGL